MFRSRRYKSSSWKIKYAWSFYYRNWQAKNWRPWKTCCLSSSKKLQWNINRAWRSLKLGITGSIIIFLLIWWLIFFLSLPININNSNKKIAIEGEDPGAPNNPQIFKKFLITTFVSVIIWFIIYFFLNNDGFLMFILKLFYMNEVI